MRPAPSSCAGRRGRWLARAPARRPRRTRLAAHGESRRRNEGALLRQHSIRLHGSGSTGAWRRPAGQLCTAFAHGIFPAPAAAAGGGPLGRRGQRARARDKRGHNARVRFGQELRGRRWRWVGGRDAWRGRSAHAARSRPIAAAKALSSRCSRRAYVDAKTTRARSRPTAARPRRGAQRASSARRSRMGSSQGSRRSRRRWASRPTRPARPST
jgi:hypothetical protein